MASTEEILVDLQATSSFIRGEVTERADSTPFEDAVALVDELERVRKAVGDAISLLNSQLLSQVEHGSRQIGTRVYAAVHDSVKRTDHSAVSGAVIDHAVAEATDKATGEVSARRAADIAVNDMLHLYVPPSKTATVGGLKRIGIAPKAVTSYEDRGRKLRIVDLALPKESDEDDE